MNFYLTSLADSHRTHVDASIVEAHRRDDADVVTQPQQTTGRNTKHACLATHIANAIQGVGVDDHTGCVVTGIRRGPDCRSAVGDLPSRGSGVEAHPVPGDPIVTSQ